MKPDISEFSYGYALTDELIHWHGTNITAAPVFPSLYEEGQPGGGYDVALNRGGIPLFLQFKLADCMVRRTAQEVRKGHLTCPFYRMHLRPARHSNQHGMLLDLEARGNEVYYSAPAFHQLDELNDAYLNHQVRRRSLWMRPSAIGPLPDDGDHHVAFRVPGASVVCSEPRKITEPSDFDAFAQRIEGSVKERRRLALRDESLSKLAEDLYSIGERREEISSEQKVEARESLRSRRPIERVAYYASMFFGLQLFVVSERE